MLRSLFSRRRADNRWNRCTNCSSDWLVSQSDDHISSLKVAHTVRETEMFPSLWEDLESCCPDCLTEALTLAKPEEDVLGRIAAWLGGAPLAHENWPYSAAPAQLRRFYYGSGVRGEKAVWKYAIDEVREIVLPYREACILVLCCSKKLDRWTRPLLRSLDLPSGMSQAGSANLDAHRLLAQLAADDGKPTELGDPPYKDALRLDVPHSDESFGGISVDLLRSGNDAANRGIMFRSRSTMLLEHDLDAHGLHDPVPTFDSWPRRDATDDLSAYRAGRDIRDACEQWDALIIRSRKLYNLGAYSQAIPLYEKILDALEGNLVLPQDDGLAPVGKKTLRKENVRRVLEYMREHC